MNGLKMPTKAELEAENDALRARLFAVGDAIDAPTYDAIFEAVYAEAKERGLSGRDARDTANDVTERLGFSAPILGLEDVEEIGFYDLRDEQDYTYPRGKKRVKLTPEGTPVRRDPKDVDTIVIHQVAIEFGVSERQVRLSGGDRELALARRALDAACHYMAFRSGFYVAAHPLDVYVNHGNRFNRHSLGVEIDGRYCGIVDDPDTAAREDLKTTWQGNPSDFNPLILETSKAMLHTMVEEARDMGMPIKYVVAHRQSNKNRRSDPGEEIWRQLVEGWAVEALNLETRPHVDIGGYRLPKQWGEGNPGDYFESHTLT